AAELERIDLDLASARDERAAIDAELAPFRVRVVTDEPAALRAAAVASDTRRAAETAVREAAESLERLAPGMAADRLVALVAGRDAVALRVEADDAARSLEDIENRLEGIQRELAEARQDLEGRAGAADAAEAESDRQQAAAAMARAIEDHLELVTTARLLRGALDGYRARHETPLLRRASLLFAELSLGEFERLAIDYTQATGTLVAVRPSGRPVDRSGLSAGTRDQLYLALRLAALELHFEQAPPLPLVVDDLFVQFSDDRAAAGFRVLERLARRTQVLVFTHHRHLIDLARATLGPNACTVQELPAEPARRETNGRQAANSA
ncbi:MAG: ATP-binding protein, partial [Pseudomonadota bacterium]